MGNEAPSWNLRKMHRPEEKRRVLVVEDEIVSAKLLSTKLNNEGYEVEVAPCGEEAIALINTWEPHLILLDIMMPGISGIGVLKYVREKFSETEMPVLMVTSRTLPADMVEALEAGANDYITKPINLKVAMARVKTHLNIVRLTKEALLKQELEALNALIATYNHEINNPLAIAMGNLERPFSQLKEAQYDKANQALLRISDIVKKIREITEGRIEYEEYPGGNKILKIRSSEYSDDVWAVESSDDGNL
jgi:DNA-binding response OmpR family regulator